MKLEKQITFKVPISMGDKLENLAKEEGLSISDVIRLAIKNALEPHSSSFFYNKRDLKNHNNSQPQPKKGQVK